MELHITHETRYDYAPAVEVAQHIAYLQPPDTPHQQTLSHALTIEPRPSQRKTTPDVFGNTRCFFSIQMAHQQLRVVAHSAVRTTSRTMAPSDVPWEQVRERFRYHANATYDSAVEFVFASRYVPRASEFDRFARTSFTPGAGLHAASLDLMHRIHAEFTYDSESTEIHTPALQALQERRGVCQDFAHIMIACLRSLGLPARYVSGYLLTQPPPGKPRLVGSDASHAWVSVMLPDLPIDDRWCDFDPTNDRWGWGAPGEDYVVLAIGRDFADVSPIRGVIHGGADHELTVAVTVAPAHEAGTTLSAPGQTPDSPSSEAP